MPSIIGAMTNRCSMPLPPPRARVGGDSNTISPSGGSTAERLLDGLVTHPSVTARPAAGVGNSAVLATGAVT